MAVALKFFSAFTLVLSFGCASATNIKPEPKPAQSRPAFQVASDAVAKVIDDGIEPDPDIERQLAPFREEIQAFSQRVVGRLLGPLTRGKPQSSLGNFVADAMLAQTRLQAGRNVDFCFTNQGGLRVDLPQGELTAGQVAEVMPFDNSVVIFSAKGQQVQNILNRIAQRGDPISGMSYTMPGEQFQIQGTPFDIHQTYEICTNDYVFGGGSNYPIDASVQAVYTGLLLRDLIEAAFLDNLGQAGGVTPYLDDRVVEGGG
ncbi:MAG: hypothetical protein CMH56_14555 [Myxococcales bacterium]|nr:hypothetical protein [Myxococcales bacterium]|tara:strand:+ start:456 stop:1232 length:777 start_codon:yes stop_codon:yes gene_type:complete